MSLIQFKEILIDALNLMVTNKIVGSLILISISATIIIAIIKYLKHKGED